MPSLLHEVLLELFRTRSTLAPELLEQVFGLELPTYSRAEIQEADLSRIVPTEYTADLVVLLWEGQPVFGIVLEVQLGRDEAKRFSWPLYGMALRAKLRCPTVVLVVTPSATVARWAGDPIATGQPGCTFQPLVLGPGGIPRVTTVEEASRAPELAVLSALAHGNEEDGVEVVLSALAAAAGLDDAHARLYYDQVMASLNEVVRRELEAMFARGDYEYQSEFARKYLAEGRRLTLQKQLRLKFGEELPSDVLESLDSANDDQINYWIERILTATTLDEVFRS